MAKFEIDSSYLIFDDGVKYIRINTSNMKYEAETGLENTLNVEFILNGILDDGKTYFDICYGLLEEVNDGEGEKVYKYITKMMAIAGLNFPEVSNFEVSTFKTYIRNVFELYGLKSGI